MRRIKFNLRSSIYALLGGAVEPSSSLLGDRTEDIRQAMLDALGPQASRRCPQVTRRVRYAGDLEGLWYLRGELMAALADLQDESHAREQMDRLTAMFQGLLSPSLVGRTDRHHT